MSQDLSPSANRLLAALPADEYERLEPYLTFASLAKGTVLYEAEERIETVYFPQTALISLVNTLKNGSTTEISLVGGTGIIGLPAIIGRGQSRQRAIIQVENGGMKISAVLLKQEFDRGGELQKLLLRYIETRLDEVAQIAVCNRHHTIEERLARWLLTVQDLIQAEELPLTQEFIGNMLGCGRSGVTLAAGSLQKSGFIRYSRGKITILDRQSLEDVACECYELFHHNFYRQY